MKNIERLDIINFDDNKWLILEMLNINEKDYLYLAKMEDDEVTDEVLIVTVSEIENEIYIDEITSEEELKMISDIFLPLIDKNY